MVARGALHELVTGSRLASRRREPVTCRLREGMGWLCFHHFRHFSAFLRLLSLFKKTTIILSDVAGADLHCTIRSHRFGYIQRFGSNDAAGHFERLVISNWIDLCWVAKMRYLFLLLFRKVAGR
jgi:hypothetical protein